MKSLKIFAATTLGVVMLAVTAFSQPYGNIQNDRRGLLTNGKIISVVSNNNLFFPSNRGPSLAWFSEYNGFTADLSFMFSGLIPLDSTKADKFSPVISSFKNEYGRYVFPSVIVSDIIGRPTMKSEQAPNGDSWSLQPVSGYFNPNQPSVAISNLAESWPATWPSDWTLNPSVAVGEYPFVFKKDFKYSTEAFYVMDDHPDFEFNLPPFNYIGNQNNPSRKGTGIKVATNVVFPDGNNYTFAKNFLFVKNRVKNISDHNFEEFGLSFLWGNLIGITGQNAYGEYDDDAIVFDPITSTIYSYDFDQNVSRNPYWFGKKVGFIGMRLIKGHSNDYNGIDDDRNEPSLGKLFAETDFQTKTVMVGDTLIVIDSNYQRSTFIINSSAPFKLITRGMSDSLLITPNLTSFVEGNYSGNLINKNSFDGIDNDFDGLIDENYLLHYHMTSANGGFSYFLPTRFIDYKNSFQNGLIDNGDKNHFYSMNSISPAGKVDLADDQKLYYDLRTFTASSSFVNNKPTYGQDEDALVSTVPFIFNSGEIADFVTVISFGNTYSEMMKNLDNAEKLWNDEFQINIPVFNFIAPDTIFNDSDQHFTWSVLNKTITNEKADIYLNFADGSSELLKQINLSDMSTDIDFSKFPSIVCQLEVKMLDSDLNGVSDQIKLVDKQLKPEIGKTKIGNMEFQIQLNKNKIIDSDKYKFVVSRKKDTHGLNYNDINVKLINTSKNETVKENVEIYPELHVTSETSFTSELVNGFSFKASHIPDADKIDLDNSFSFPSNINTSFLNSKFFSLSGQKYTFRSDSLLDMKIVPGIDTSTVFLFKTLNRPSVKTNFKVLDKNGKQLDFVFNDSSVKGVLDRLDEIWVLYKDTTQTEVGDTLYGIPNSNFHFGQFCQILTKDNNNTSVDSISVKVNYGLNNPVEINVDPSVLLSVHNSKPHEFSISDIYPNPFNPSTNMTITTGQNQGNYNFRVYDLLGRLVYSESKLLPANSNYTWQWKSNSNQGGHVTSGMYLIEVSTASAKFVKKAMLLK